MVFFYRTIIITNQSITECKTCDVAISICIYYRIFKISLSYKTKILRNISTM